MSSLRLKQFGVLLGVRKLCKAALFCVTVRVRTDCIVLVSCLQCLCEIWFVVCCGLTLVWNRVLVVQTPLMLMIMCRLTRKAPIGVW